MEIYPLLKRQHFLGHLESSLENVQIQIFPISLVQHDRLPALCRHFHLPRENGLLLLQQILRCPVQSTLFHGNTLGPLNLAFQQFPRNRLWLRIAPGFQENAVGYSPGNGAGLQCYCLHRLMWPLGHISDGQSTSSCRGVGRWGWGGGWGGVEGGWGLGLGVGFGGGGVGGGWGGGGGGGWGQLLPILWSWPIQNCLDELSHEYHWHQTPWFQCRTVHTSVVSASGQISWIAWAQSRGLPMSAQILHYIDVI